MTDAQALVPPGIGGGEHSTGSPPLLRVPPPSPAPASPLVLTRSGALEVPPPPKSLVIDAAALTKISSLAMTGAVRTAVRTPGKNLDNGPRWRLYCYSPGGGLDPEPEFIGEYASLAEAAAKVRRQCIAAHETCPNECAPVEAFPADVVYDPKDQRAHEQKGAFFRLPSVEPDELGFDAIPLGIFPDGSPYVEFYARRKGWHEHDDDEDEDGGDDEHDSGPIEGASADDSGPASPK